MLDKLKSLISSEPEREFKPRTQGLRERSPASSEMTASDHGEHKSMEGRGVLIGYDYLKMKGNDQSPEQRIQTKLDLIKQLEKELGIHGKSR
jgi:hypothetical protein